MRVTAEQLSRVVAETSAGATDPSHVANVVGAFIRRQPLVGHYVTAQQRELSLEGSVLVLLHAAVVARAVEIATGRALPPLSATQLDAATRAPPLASHEPELDGYLESNLAVDDPTLGGARRPVALGVLRAIAAALLAL